MSTHSVIKNGKITFMCDVDPFPTGAISCTRLCSQDPSDIWNPPLYYHKKFLNTSVGLINTIKALCGLDLEKSATTIFMKQIIIYCKIKLPCLTTKANY